MMEYWRRVPESGTLNSNTPLLHYSRASPTGGANKKAASLAPHNALRPQPGMDKIWSKVPRPWTLRRTGGNQHHSGQRQTDARFPECGRRAHARAG